MHGWTIHLTVFAAVNGFLVFFWLLTGGSVDALGAVAANPTVAGTEGFWPVWPLAVWSTGLLIHTGVALANGAFGIRARRRRRARRRELRRAWKRTSRWAAGLAEARLEARRDRAVAEAAPQVEAGTRQWVAVMFTDIADSTPLNESLGDDAWREVLRRHRATVRAEVERGGGREVSTHGDAFFVQFTEATTAVRCAVAIQRVLAEQRGGEGLVPETRIGLHAGEAVADDGGDLLGHVVNLASRVTGAAAGGEILVTEAVVDLTPTEIDYVDRGLETLKGVRQPRHLLAVKWEGDG